MNIFQKLAHFLFGWHYVLVLDCHSQHICRVKMYPDGKLRGVIISRLFTIYDDGSISGGYNIKDWVPLTWKMKKAEQS